MLTAQDWVQWFTEFGSHDQSFVLLPLIQSLTLYVPLTIFSSLCLSLCFFPPQQNRILDSLDAIHYAMPYGLAHAQ